MIIALYHRTTEKAARAILTGGFRDNTGHYGTLKRWTGVWLSNVPATINEGAEGNTLLRVFLRLSARELRFYEWVEQGRSFREFLIPAKVVNARRRSIVPIAPWREYSGLWSP